MEDGTGAPIGLWRLSRSIRPRVGTLQAVVLLVAVAIALPPVAAFLDVAVRGSDLPVLADLDIPGALEGPGGWVLVAVVVLAWSTVELLGHAAQLVVAHEALHRRDVGVSAALARVAGRFRPLLALILRFAIQSLAIALPFLLLAFGVLRIQLAQRGLDESLVERPPEFVLAVTLAALLLTGMGFALVRHLIDWLLALPLLLFHGASPAEARRRGRRLATGHRARWFLQLIGWLALPPLAALAIVVAMISPLVRVADLLGDRVGITSLLVVLALGLATLLGLAVRFLCATFFTAWHARLGARAGLDGGTAEPAPAAGGRVPWAVTLAAAAIVVATALWGHFRLEALKRDQPVIVFAHRGASSEAPENTLAAVEAGIDAGADWIEIDVRHHPSGELLVFHDADLRRVAGRAGKLREVEVETIRGLDVGSWFGDDYKGERVPTLGEVLAACAGRCGLLVELKSSGPRAPFAEAVVAAVEQAGAAGSVMLMSFDPELVARLGELRPDWMIGLTTSAPPGDLEGLGVDFLAVGRGVLSRDLTRRARLAGIEVYAWTVNDGIDISSAVSRGADGVITDRPREARRVLAERAQLNPGERLAIDLLSRVALIHDLLRR